MTDATILDGSDGLSERLLHSTIGALELFSVYLGVALGLYRSLEDAGPLEAGELASRTGIDERYAREWLEQQAVAGLLEVRDGRSEGDRRRYRLTPGHARVLCHPEDPAHAAPFAHMIAGIGGVIEDVACAYRSGGGVPYASYGVAFREGQGNINRATVTHDLPTTWLGSMPDVVARLEASARPRIADIGCGEGWSTLAMARAFPHAWVDGVDADAASILAGRRHAAAAGLDGRVCFVEGDAAGLAGESRYDLVLILEALHDLARPVEALEAIRAALAPGGTLLVVDERVADAFTAPGDAVERMMFGWSVTHCLPTQMVDRPSAALGTALRADMVRDLAHRAGYSSVHVLPVHNDFFRLYRLDP